ncbi:microtubule-associated protein tau-like [Neocloeon triangulifer]|uniref:microtubule-associated protein tau-like n=1 Tax=Neocloeon triangulifer TaxID=2078957 RepID=UPI00286FAD14|nr:microtubule-associated protein tau-like [Neocloeon triangulifer]
MAEANVQNIPPASNGQEAKEAATRRPQVARNGAVNRRSSTGKTSPATSPLKPTAGARSASLTPDPHNERKKLPMNKVQVGQAASPNLKVVRSKIGSLQNADHKPGGGQVKIESRKVDFSKTGSRITAKNDTYQPGGGEKKIQSTKLEWTAKSKIGSLENATHKPGGGAKKIETQQLSFKEQAKSKVGSKDNLKHQAGGGNVKIETKKLDFKVTSKVGSLANVTHKPGGGDVKIFDDKEYIKQMKQEGSEGKSSGNQSPLLHSSTSDLEHEGLQQAPNRS